MGDKRFIIRTKSNSLYTVIKRKDSLFSKANYFLIRKGKECQILFLEGKEIKDRKSNIIISKELISFKKIKSYKQFKDKRVIFSNKNNWGDLYNKILAGDENKLKYLGSTNKIVSISPEPNL